MGLHAVPIRFDDRQKMVIDGEEEVRVAGDADEAEAVAEALHDVHDCERCSRHGASGSVGVATKPVDKSRIGGPSWPNKISLGLLQDDERLTGMHRPRGKEYDTSPQG